ncbi:putative CCCH-type zinc finger family protein [Tanacetum coccineum]
MYTRGRKKAEAEPALPAHSPTEEAETEPNIWDKESVDVNPFGEGKHRYVNRLYQPRRNDRAIDHNDRYRDDPICSLGLKIEIPEFIGKVHPDDFIDWLSTVKQVFDVRDIPDKLKVKLVAIKLRQHASSWWDHVNKRRRIEGKSKVETWEKMKKLMKAKFLPENHRQEAFLDYHNLSQRNMTMEEAKSKGSTSRFTSRFTPPTRTAPPTAPKATTPTTSAAGNTRERVDNSPCCYKCGGIRHYARDCSNLKTLAFVPDDTGPIYDTDVEPKVDEPGDELVYPNCGEALVFQRVLNVVVSKSVDDNSWLRNNIFRTKCTSKGKICDMIIDGGSCENVISTYMFSIGKNYKDKVWCEVIPMDEAHILLGHPWQFDRKTKHDGFQNTYSFKKDGVNITLVPFDSRQTQAEGSNLFMKKTDFEGLMKTSPYVFTLVVVEENEIISEAPLQHCIDFIPGSAIPNRPAYRMNPKEFAELQRQVTELLEKGLIRESMSPCAVPALLVPKHGGTFRMCIDSRAVNKITIKYRFPIPRLDDLLDQLHGSTIFSKIDLRSGYHQIRMRPGDEWKTAFKTRDGLYEWMVMPFGLSNAPSTFMRLMNQVFKPFIGHFVVVYFDDILIYSSSLEQHLSHLRQIFSVLRAQKLYANGEKCYFLVTEVTFLGYIVTGSGIKMDPTKFEAIISWLTPSTIHDIRSFHGVVDSRGQFECDASRVGIGGVLSQNQRPIAFFSEKLNDARRNGQHKLKPRHAKWVEFIQAFSFVILHKVGLDNQVADALSRRHSLITTMHIRVQGFDLFRGLYCDDPAFREIWNKCDNGPFQQFSKPDGYLFKGVRLCIPLCSLCEAIILEGHAGGLAGHFGRDKTLALLREQFYWPKMEHDVNTLLERCRTCHIAKTYSSNVGLYTPLSVPVALWEDMAHFVPCSKTFDASQVARLYFAEIVKLYGVPKTLTSDRDVKFTEVVNRSLGNLLRSLIRDNAKQWDLILPQAEFAYNRSVNCTTCKSPFEVVYGRNLITPLDLVPVPKVGWFSEEGGDQSEQIKELHRSGDLVWIHLRKERFPVGHFGKLKPRGDGPFRVLKKINDNAYKIELPGHYNVFATFNVADLSPYKGDSGDEPDSRSILF